MNSKPLVSVIIPTFNRAELVCRAIDSVIAQTYKNFEIIIIDDGSTDLTRPKLEEYSNLTLIFNDKNRGVSYCRNKALSISKGELVCFLDSDDEWLAGKLDKQVDFLASTDFNWCHGEEIWMRKGKRVNPKKIHKKGGGDQFLPSLGLCLISPSTVMLKKDLLLKHQGFDEDFIVCEDYDLWLRILVDEPIGFIDENLIVKYGGHEDQLSQKYFGMDEYRVRTLQKLSKLKLSCDRQKHVKEMLISKCEILRRGFSKHGNSEKELYYLNILNQL